MAKTGTETKKPELIDICLPLPRDDDGTGKVDLMESVTINGETTLIKRGEHVQVTPAVFMVLYRSGRYPNL